MLIPMSNMKRLDELMRWTHGLSSVVTGPVLKKKPRFIKATPGVFSKQIMYDRLGKSFFTVNSRDHVDLQVVRQIFINEDYALKSSAHADALAQYLLKVVKSGKKPLIIDCGGNSGLATRYFCETYKGARVVCIEPEVTNLTTAKMNNQDTQIHFMLAGIGCADARADIVDPGDGNWSYRTETSETGEIEIVSVNSILSDARFQDCTPFIIKIDIEGFERNLFEKNLEWLDAFPLLIIELHDWMLPGHASSNNFLRAISQRDRDFVYRNENVFSISNTLL